MVLETLNSKEATYLWKLDAPPSQLDESRDLLRQKFEWVEQEISIISAEGREVYKANKPKGFARVRHDYKSENGFETWKLRLHQVLAGDSECYGNF